MDFRTLPAEQERMRPSMDASRNNWKQSHPLTICRSAEAASRKTGALESGHNRDQNHSWERHMSVVGLDTQRSADT
jgi:hypothetical protein